MSDASTYTAAKYGLEAGYAEGYAAALRDAWTAVRAALGPMDCIDPDQMVTALAAIEALGGER